MARRSSARLRGRESTTPRRVFLSNDFTARTPKTAPIKLGSLIESDDMPGAFPTSPSAQGTPSRGTVATPTKGTPIQPSVEEKHPAQHQHSTTKAKQKARHLGFSDMAPHTEPPKHTSRIAMLQETPTRSSSKPEATGFEAPNFKFTFQREHSLELSPDGKLMMMEKREEAARIREQMVANGEGPKSAAQSVGRRMAVPKAKNRFDDAHSAQFQKMNSIANHASAFRADPTRMGVITPGALTQSISRQSPKSLKRSPSKADLDLTDAAPRGGLKRSPSKLMLGGNLPNAPPSRNLGHRGAGEPSSPAKRVKRSETDDASTMRLSSGDEHYRLATPPSNKRLPMYPDLTKLTTCTTSSLAHATTSVEKVSHIPGPHFSSVKPTVSFAPSVKDATIHPTGPLLARSPSKGTIFAGPATAKKVDNTTGPSGPLLTRSPSKISLFKKATEPVTSTHELKVAASPLLSRSPSKMSLNQGPVMDVASQNTSVSKAPLLSRSPIKMSVLKQPETEPKEEVKRPSAIPFLARSPSKIAIPPVPEASSDSSSTKGFGKSPGKSLMGRFNLLRSTPVKSILRSPQRLYSDDPAKVAAGTHIATPPRFDMKPVQSNPPATAPVSKRVDFSSSTKARDAVTPTKTTAISLNFGTERTAAPVAAYPSLPAIDNSPSPQKRRQTIMPGDFTFRNGEHDIIFSRSPNAPAGSGKSKRPSTIRHVSADNAIPPPPVAGSKKRKFEFENAVPVAVGDVAMAEVENKENVAGNGWTDIGDDEGDEEQQRPAKRTKTNPISPAKSAAKKPAPTSKTPGVKPRGFNGAGEGGKRPTITISQARLASLSLPKKRS